ncbi:unnamed protein product [Cochlearia groenlandica]
MPHDSWGSIPSLDSFQQGIDGDRRTDSFEQRIHEEEIVSHESDLLLPVQDVEDVYEEETQTMINDIELHMEKTSIQVAISDL